MAFFIHGIDDPQYVKQIRDELLAIIAGGTFTTEYTVQGNDFKKQLVIAPSQMRAFINDCNEFLIEELLGRPRARRTNTWIYR